MKRNILFLCSFNAGRSILAESLLNTFAHERFTGYSAGEAPKAAIHPQAAATLQSHGHSLDGLKPKSWQDFLVSGAPQIDLAITLCNNAEGEMCMVLGERFPVAHWDVPDPALANSDSERQALFEQAYRRLERLIRDVDDLPDNYLGQRFADAVTRLGYMDQPLA